MIGNTVLCGLRLANSVVHVKCGQLSSCITKNSEKQIESKKLPVSEAASSAEEWHNWLLARMCAWSFGECQG